jgi:hypothetical protein
LISLTPEERIKAIKYSDIKRIQETDNDLFSYQVTSSKDKETKYLVFKSQALGWTCTCKDFQYRSDPLDNIYQCKHIKRVLAMIEVSAERQFKQASKEVPK